MKKMASILGINNKNKTNDANGDSNNANESLFRQNQGDAIVFSEINPRWDLDEIILNTEIKNEIRDIIAFCKNQKELIQKFELDKFLKGRESVGINLYGCPGTGKSITAEAIAKSLGRKMIEVDYAGIQSEKWGGTEKRLSALFKYAEEHGAVIFMDEADGIMGKRTSGVNSDVAYQIKSHLLTLVDRSNVFIIYATNLFENMDRAFFRRILFHVNYQMPRHDELVKLWQLHIGSNNLPKDDQDFSYDEIANMSDGLLAGGDIKNIALKLCVKIGVGRISMLTNDVVKREIELYKKSLNDSKGVNINEQQ